jgi:hypothetical protein
VTDFELIGVDFGYEDATAVGLSTVGELRWRRDRWEREMEARRNAFEGIHRTASAAMLYAARAAYAKKVAPLWLARNRRQRKNPLRTIWGRQRMAEHEPWFQAINSRASLMAKGFVVPTWGQQR